MMAHWQTWWSIVGTSLPEKEKRLLDCVFLAPLTEKQFSDQNSLRPPQREMPPSNHFYVQHYPPYDRVRSWHRMQIDVEAGSADEAEKIATKIANRLLAAFTLKTGTRYFAELKRLRNLGETGEISAWSQPLMGVVFNETTPLIDADLAEIEKLYADMGKSAGVEEAYGHLLTAWQLQATGGSKPLKRPIMQHYVLCIEAVVNAVMVAIRKKRAKEIAERERFYVEEFLAKLHKQKDKVGAIRSASTKLRALGLQNMLPSIDLAGEYLELDASVIRDAREMYRLRSSSLSHPGRDDTDKIDKWLDRGTGIAQLCQADRVARLFMLSLCEK